MQVLEGPKDDVKALAEKIRQDSRHTDMEIVYEKSVETAEFSKWSMGFRTPETRAEMDVFFNLTRAELSAQIPKDARWDVRKAITSFADQVGLDWLNERSCFNRGLPNITERCEVTGLIRITVIV